MDAQLESLMKQVSDMNGLLATLAKERGHDDGKVNFEAIYKDEFEKMKADIIEQVDKKLAKSKTPEILPDNEDEKRKNFKLSRWLKAIRYGNDNEYLKTYMSEGTPAQGGYTVPVGYDKDIYGYLNETPTVVQKCTPYPHGQMDGFTKNIPKWLTGVTIRWADEAGVKSTTKPTLTPKQSVLKKMYAMIPFTDEYLQDDISDINQKVAQLVGEGMAVELERIILAGNTGGGDPFMGVGYDAGVNTSAQAGGNLTFNDILTITGNNMNEKYHEGAEMYMRRSVRNLIIGLVDGNGRPLWNFNTINNKMEQYVLGVPINLSSQCVATQILYGNWKHVLIGNKSGGLGAGIQVDYSNSAVDADSSNYWTQDMTGYRFVQRRSVVVVNPDGFYKMTGVA